MFYIEYKITCRKGLDISDKVDKGKTPCLMARVNNIIYREDL